MTRAHIRENLTETMMVTSSAAFLAWYIAAKIMVWPWGACWF